MSTDEELKALPLLLHLPGTVEDGKHFFTCVTHYLYIKEHKIKKPTKELPPQRTLFILNLPIAAKETLQKVFSSFGKVTDVQLTHVSTGSKKKGKAEGTTLAAHVVFQKPDTLKVVLEKAKAGADPIEIKEFPLDTVVYEKQYDEATCKDLNAIQEEVDLAVAAFDDEKERRRAQSLTQSIKDEGDGWFTVTAGGDLGTQKKEATKTRSDVKSRLRARKKKKDLSNIYRFRQLEAQKEGFEDFLHSYEIPCGWDSFSLSDSKAYCSTLI
eukprot:gene10575-2699_t